MRFVFLSIALCLRAIGHCAGFAKDLIILLHITFFSVPFCSVRLSPVSSRLSRNEMSSRDRPRNTFPVGCNGRERQDTGEAKKSKRNTVQGCKSGKYCCHQKFNIRQTVDSPGVLGGFLWSLPTPFGSYTEAEDDREKGTTSVSIKYLYIPSLCHLSQKGARASWAEIIDFGTEIGASFTIRRSLTHRNRLSNCQLGLFFLSHNFISHFLIPYPRTGALPQSGLAILIIGAARIVGII